MAEDDDKETGGKVDEVDELGAVSVALARSMLRDWAATFDAVAVVQAHDPDARAEAERRPTVDGVRAAIPELARIYHPRTVKEIAAVCRGAELALAEAGAESLDRRLQVVEEALAGLGAILSSPPDPDPADASEDRVDALEQVVTGAGAVLRSLR